MLFGTKRIVYFLFLLSLLVHGGIAIVCIIRKLYFPMFCRKLKQINKLMVGSNDA